MPKKFSENTTDLQLQEVLLSDDHVNSRSITSQTNRPGPLCRGWRSGMLYAICIVSLALCTNTISMIVLATKHGVNSGVGTILTGPCDTVSKWSTGLHICINLLGSMLLSASNYSMQSVCAPTRSEVDEAHARGDWLDIGVPSVRNLSGRISFARARLYIVLALSSLPLHLLYNSAIFKTTSSNNYNVLIAPPDFLSNANYTNATNRYGPDLPSGSDCPFDGTFNITSNDPQCQAYTQSLITLEFFLKSATDAELVRNLSSADCITAYNTQFLNQLSDLLLISYSPDLPPANQSMLTTESWISGDTAPSSWIFSDCNSSLCDAKGLEKSADQWTFEGFTIDHCLARAEQSQCNLRFSAYILAAVVASNLIKLGAMVWILVDNRDETLVTSGDAMASYLKRPDQYTLGLCMHNGRSLKGTLRNRKKSRSAVRSIGVEPMVFRPYRKQWWFKAASPRRWLVTIGLCLLVILTAMVLLGDAVSTANSSGMGLTTGFGALDSATTLGPYSFICAVLIANSPQLVVSMLHVNYNGLWTAILLASEWDDRCAQPKPLRVSSPKGKQRSTYWLQLPFTYSIPLLLAMTCLHWLISESLFSAQVEFNTGDAFEALLQPENLSIVAYSCLPLLLSIIWGSLIVIAVVAVGFRRFTNPIPIASSCSLAIAAACHRPKEDLDAAYLPVSWGEVDFDGQIGHCCFTSYAVQAPTVGRMYA